MLKKAKKSAKKTVKKVGPKLEPVKKIEPLDTITSVLAALKNLATQETLDGMAQYGIPSDKAWGVAMGDIQKLAKRVGRNHAMAASLWETGVYEARLMSAFVEEPDRVTPAQMNRWCRDFDNWAVVDTLCFKLFDQTPHAYAAVERWAEAKPEFEKRAAFALLAALALHDKETTDDKFLHLLPLIEKAATDPRNFVKKGVSWALRAIGSRKSSYLRKAAMNLAMSLAEAEDEDSRWVGKDVVRDLQKKTGKPNK